MAEKKDRNTLRHEWAGRLSGVPPMANLHPMRSLPLVNASLDFLRGLTDEEREELIGGAGT